ncbi:MAG: 8-amino-7-oxononanoate synthase [Salinisphaeraceae bacterium]|nr:8-amino-7-oxononanoate synthase [Salinisphaeraceae bacterium]
MSASLNRFLQARLAETRARNLYRRRRVVEGAHGVQARVDGADLALFCSNDYLGLATHPELIAATAKAAQTQGVGSGASQLITGHNQAHQALENELADYVQRDRALLLSSGYLANVGVISALMGREDIIFSDALNHASLIDGMRLSRAQIQPYAHADLSALQQALHDCSAQHRLIVSDAVFSMDGDVADLPALADLARDQDAWLMVDDAHGLGVMGPQGRGAVAAAGLDAQSVPILTATLGKSLGAAGAFVAGSEDLIEALIQSTRTFIFSTAMPPAVAEAARVGLRLSRDEGWRRDKLFELIEQFRAGARSRGLPIGDSQTAIQPLILGAEQRALEVSEKLLAQGFLVTAIRPPTVPAGTSRLRITLSAAHEPAQVQALLDALAKVLL